MPTSIRSILCFSVPIREHRSGRCNAPGVAPYNGFKFSGGRRFDVNIIRCWNAEK